MSWRLVSVIVLAIAALLVAGGRWERSRQAHREDNGFRIVERLVGSLDAPSLSGYRTGPEFDCLTYRRGTNPFALELCVDKQGRVVEAIDRRTFTRRIWSLRSDPSASDVRVSRPEVDRLLHKMGAT